MNASVIHLIGELKSDNAAERTDAARALGLWLETRRVKHPNTKLYSEFLPSDLLEIQPSSEDEKAIVSELESVVSVESSAPTVIWALGKATCGEAFDVLATVLHAPAQDEEMVWQALVAIDNWTTDPTKIKGLESVLKRLGQSNNDRIRTISTRIAGRAVQH